MHFFPNLYSNPDMLVQLLESSLCIMRYLQEENCSEMYEFANPTQIETSMRASAHVAIHNKDMQENVKAMDSNRVASLKTFGPDAGKG